MEKRTSGMRSIGIKFISGIFVVLYFGSICFYIFFLRIASCAICTRLDWCLFFECNLFFSFNDWKGNIWLEIREKMVDDMAAARCIVEGDPILTSGIVFVNLINGHMISSFEIEFRKNQ